jgi:hypothetical protein
MPEHLDERLTAANDEQLAISTQVEVSFLNELETPADCSKKTAPLMGALPDPSEQAEFPPLNVSDFTGSEANQPSFMRGAKLLGLDTPRKPLAHQQVTISRALNATRANGLALHTVTAVAAPRRATKTTSVWAVALGRLMDPELPDYQVSFTAQTGAKARERFLKDLVAPLERAFPEPSDRPFTINRSSGASHIHWPDGSRLSILPPLPDSFRGDAYDMVIVDEAQTFDPDESADLLAAILPTFLTRRGAQLVLLGTAGEFRSGMFHDYLEKGRAGTSGIVEYAAPEDTPLHEIEPDEDTDITGTTADPEVWARANPGIGTLTDIESVRMSFDAMTPENFAREFLGIWSDGQSSNSFLNMVKIEAGAIEGPVPAPPQRFSLGMAVHRDQTYSALCAAWRDESGAAVVAILDHRKGVNWVAERAAYFSLKYRTPIVHDPQKGASSMVAEAFNRITPRPKTDPQVWAQVSNASELFVKTINDGNLKHFSEQPEFMEAARLVQKRVGRQSKRWAFGTDLPEQNIVIIEACAMALRSFDDLPVKRALPRMTAA